MKSDILYEQQRTFFYVSKCPVIAFFDITSRDYLYGDKSPRYWRDLINRRDTIDDV